MLFNSIEFAIFLPIVFTLYWLIFFRCSVNIRNTFILLVSYLFYGWWDWNFLLLIFISSVVDYSIGLLLGKSNKQVNKRILLGISLLVNLGLLGFFKYFNFFVESFRDAFSLFGDNFNTTSLDILLPVGISFYTLQTLSYTIDVYKGKISPTKNIPAFFAFVAFFPQLVAGPIERASDLLPQFFEKRKFQYETGKDGIKQILWGLFKKIAIADTLAIYVNEIFSNPEHATSGTLAIGAIFFCFQLYADFSGYSDIAIGTAKLFGFKLTKNFTYPFFARNIAEFWRRWHISLNTWFVNYLYIPLGGSRVSKIKKIRNIFIIFTVSGLWHGASYNFLIWGLLNALFFIPLILFNKNRAYTESIDPKKHMPTIKEMLQMITTFLLFAFPLIFFRAETLSDSIYYINKIFTFDSITIPLTYFGSIHLLMLMILLEWFQRTQEHPLQLKIKNKLGRFLVYFLIFYLTIAYISNESVEFIYFQF